MGAKPPYPMESTTIMGRNTVVTIHMMKESFYNKLKY